MAAHKMRPMKDKADVLIKFDDEIHRLLIRLEDELSIRRKSSTKEETLFLQKLAAAVNNLQRAWRHVSQGDRHQFKDRQFLSSIRAVETNIHGVCELLRRELERDRPEHLKGLPPFPSIDD